MARKKKRTSKRSGKRRVGAAGGNKAFLMQAAGLLAVSAFGSKLTAMIPTSVSPTIVGAGEAGVGFFIAKKAKNPLLEGIGLGLLVMGGTTLMKGFGIAGTPDYGPVNFRQVAGPGGYPALNTIGNAQQDMMAGFTPEMNTIGGNEYAEMEEDYFDGAY